MWSFDKYIRKENFLTSSQMKVHWNKFDSLLNLANLTLLACNLPLV